MQVSWDTYLSAGGGNSLVVEYRSFITVSKPREPNSMIFLNTVSNGHRLLLQIVIVGNCIKRIKGELYTIGTLIK